MRQDRSMTNRLLVTYRIALADPMQPVALEGFLAASLSIDGQRGLSDLALSTTRNAVERLKKRCTATFGVSRELPLPTIAVLPFAAVRRLILNAAGCPQAKALRSWGSAFRCVAGAEQVTP